MAADANRPLPSGDCVRQSRCFRFARDPQGTLLPRNCRLKVLLSAACHDHGLAAVGLGWAFAPSERETIVVGTNPAVTASRQ